MEGIDIEDIIAIILALGFPIVAVIGAVWAIVAKVRSKENIIKNIAKEGLDPEYAKELVQNLRPERNVFTSLRWGAALFGLGIGALIAHALKFGVEDLYMWLMLALGMGFGFIVSFVIEMLLTKRQAPKPTDSEKRLDAPLKIKIK